MHFMTRAHICICTCKLFIANIHTVQEPTKYCYKLLKYLIQLILANYKRLIDQTDATMNTIFYNIKQFIMLNINSVIIYKLFLYNHIVIIIIGCNHESK